MGVAKEKEAPAFIIARILNECQHSQGSHRRSIKVLVQCRRDDKSEFMKEWEKMLLPIFQIIKREPVVERLIKFMAAFAAHRDDNHAAECDAFAERFLSFLLPFADASSKSVRFRACQLISEVMALLREEAEINIELLDDVVRCMQRRMQDKLSGVRTFAARSLSRLISVDVSGNFENDQTISQYRQALTSDPNPDVRRSVLMSIPPSNTTAPDIVERTSDVHDLVRKTAYSILGSKFPLQSLSIRQRTCILQRGLSDRVAVVKAECAKMLKDLWLFRDCDGDLITLLQYLDVETNERVGELVMQECIKQELCNLNKRASLKSLLIPKEGNNCVDKVAPDSNQTPVNLLEAEEALYWRVMCTYLHSEAQAKGSSAANTGGAEAVVNAEAAAENTEALERILPPTVSDYIALVEKHLQAGPNYRFATRQLLILAKVLDFSDITNQRAAACLIHNLLGEKIPLNEQINQDDIRMTFLDGISLGGEKEWTEAVAELAQKVHPRIPDFEEAVSGVVAELGRPCREGGATDEQWLQSLAVTGLFLERLKSLKLYASSIIEPQEIVDGLLLPAAKHIHTGVQQAGVRCLGLFCQLEEKPSSRIVLQLYRNLHVGPLIVKRMAAKALFDLILCHSATLVDKILGTMLDSVPQPDAPGVHISEPPILREPILDELLQLDESLDQFEEELVEGDSETVQSIIAEGFAKILIQSKRYPELLHLQHKAVAKLLHLHFSEDTKCLIRLRQSLSVFFSKYASLAPEHKQSIARAFLPVMRFEWPGIYMNLKCNPSILASKKKTATQLCHFMLELLKQPLYTGNDEGTEGQSLEELPDMGHEKLAITIAREMIKIGSKKTALVKGYKGLLCKVLTSLDFRSSSQGEIKYMRSLLDLLMDSISGEKLMLKDVKLMVARLEMLDETPRDCLSQLEVQALLGSLDLYDPQNSEEPPATPVPTGRKTVIKRRSRRAGTPDNDASMQLETPAPYTRTQRTCKTEALLKMQSRVRTIHFESESSESHSTTSEDESD